MGELPSEMIAEPLVALLLRQRLAHVIEGAPLERGGHAPRGVSLALEGAGDLSEGVELLRPELIRLWRPLPVALVDREQRREQCQEQEQKGIGALPLLVRLEE